MLMNAIDTWKPQKGSEPPNSYRCVKLVSVRKIDSCAFTSLRAIMRVLLKQMIDKAASLVRCRFWDTYGAPGKGPTLERAPSLPFPDQSYEN